MNERESSGGNYGIGPIAEVIEQKLDNLIEAVKEIKETMHDNSVDIANLKLELNTCKTKIDVQNEKVEELRERYKANKTQITGVALTVIAALLIALLKVVVPML